MSQREAGCVHPWKENLSPLGRTVRDLELIGICEEVGVFLHFLSNRDVNSLHFNQCLIYFTSYACYLYVCLITSLELHCDMFISQNVT